MSFRKGLGSGEEGRFLPERFAGGKIFAAIYPLNLILSASGAVQAQNATGLGLASYETAASGNAQAQNATASGIATVEITASGAVQAQNATASGSATVPTGDREASGAVQAQNATALGSALVETIATGSAQAQNATATGLAFIETVASGSVQAQNATATGSAQIPTDDREASGAVQAQNATATGSAIVETTASGSAQAQNATATGSTLVATSASGAAQAQNATASGSATIETTASGAAQAQAATATGTASNGVDYSFLTDGLIGAWGLEEIIPGFTGTSCTLERPSIPDTSSFTTAEIASDNHKTYANGISTRLLTLFDQSGNNNDLTTGGTPMLVYRTSTDEYYEINGMTGFSPVTADLIRYYTLGTSAKVRSAFFVLSDVPASTDVTGLMGNNGPSTGQSYVFVRTSGAYQISVDGQGVSDLGAAVINGGSLTAGGQDNFNIDGSSIFPSTPTALGIIMDALTQTDIDIVGALATDNSNQSSGPDTRFGAVLLYSTDKTSVVSQIQSHLMGLFGIT